MEKSQNLLIEILINTKELRHLQREYFRTRSKFILSKCKEMERKVDALIIKFELVNSIPSLQQKKVQSIQSTLNLPLP